MNDVTKCCRVCLQTEGKMKLLNDKDICGNMKIIDKITIFVNINKKNIYDRPQNICLKCLDDLHRAYRFKTNCEKAEKLLNLYAKGRHNRNVVNDLINSSNLTEKMIEQPLSSSASLQNKRSTRSSTKINSEQQQNNNSDSPPGPLINIKSENKQSIETVYVNPADIIQDDDSNMNEEDHSMINNFDDQIDEFHISTGSFCKSINSKISNEKQSSINENPIEFVEPTTSKKIKVELSEPSDNEENVPSKYKRKKKEEKPLKICETCGNSYKFQHSLDSHMRRHRNEKPFSCEICGRSFVLNFELIRHMRTHTGQKPYACHYCDRKYSDYGSRVKHERSHTGERPYSCETCGKAFAYSHVLASHILTHTGEKPFCCDECGKRFTKKHHLKSHKNTHAKAGNQTKKPINNKNNSNNTVLQTNTVTKTNTIQNKNIENNITMPQDNYNNSTTDTYLDMMSNQGDIVAFNLVDDEKLRDHFVKDGNIQIIFSQNPNTT